MNRLLNNSNPCFGKIKFLHQRFLSRIKVFVLLYLFTGIISFGTYSQGPAPLASSRTYVHVLCNGGSNGSINLTVTGGVAPYSYLWVATGNGVVPTGQANNQDLTGLVAGTYTVTIRDANQTTITDSKTISQPSLLKSSRTYVHVLCRNEASGSIDLTVTGGTPTYTYLWVASGNGVVPAGQANNQDLTGLVAGLYKVTIRDQCTSITDYKTISQPSLLKSSRTYVHVLGDATGSIDLTVTGGTPPYTYLWVASENGVVPAGQANNQDLTGLVAGLYKVTIRDQCTSITNSKTIEIVPDNLIVNTFPNPFNDNITFKFKPHMSGMAVLDVYNLKGQKIKTVFAGNVTAGTNRTIQFAVPVQSRSTLFYRLKIGDKTTTGKVLHIN